MTDATHHPPQQTSNDATLDAVLVALRDARPEDGLEQRVLARLQALPETDAASLPGRGRTAGSSHRAKVVPRMAGIAALPGWTWLRPLGLSALAALLLVAAVAGWHRASQQTEHSAFQYHSNSRWLQTAEQVPMQTTATATSASRAQTASTMNAATTGLPPTVPQRTAALARFYPTPSSQTGRPTATRTEDAAAVQEASFPAPPMPLTEQEQLLLRIAHRNDPVELALLDPVAREVEAAREHAQFRRFFTPPTLPDDLQKEIDKAVQAPYTYAHTEPAPDRTLP